MARKTILLSISLIFFLIALAPAFANTLEQAISDFQNGDYKNAQDTWQDLARNNDPDALFNLGQLFHLGQGVVFNETKAAEYFLSAAQMGHTAAQRELANIYFFSSGTPEHQTAAIAWWQQAAAAGDGRSQYILGVLFFTGDLVPQNMALGFAWTLLAIDGGIDEAIQSEAAMRGQLSAGDLARSIDLSGSLMKGQPNQAHFSLLVAEEASRRRVSPPPIQVAEAQSEIEVEEPVFTPGPEPEDQPTEPEQNAKETASADETPVNTPEEAAGQGPGDGIVESGAGDLKAVTTPELETVEIPEQDPGAAIDEPVVDPVTQDPALDPVLDNTQPPPEEEVTEIPDALVIDVQTTPIETTPVETRDLGDPLSPLVDAVGFQDQWRVQVTSFRLPENAEQHWQDVNADFPEIFAGLDKRIVRADLGPERGVYYRLRVGPFATKEDADLKCLELLDAGLGCLVIWP
ncbi:MAG: SPOR domain-containing protein [Sphingomonadales bacterium]